MAKKTYNSFTMKPIVVIPTYNEQANIARLIRAIFSLGIANLSVVVVDDNSPDGTADTVQVLSEEYPITLIRREGKLGLGSAYVAGFTKAMELEATHIFEMDADFSHDPNDLPRLLEVDADLVIGSRKIAGGRIVGWGMWRLFMSHGAMIFSRLLLGLKTKDVTAGFRCFTREALEAIDFRSVKTNGYAFQEELVYRAEKRKLRVVEIPVTFVDREHGKSKLSKKDIVEFFVVMIALRIKKS